MHKSLVRAQEVRSENLGARLGLQCADEVPLTNEPTSFKESRVNSSPADRSFRPAQEDSVTGL